MTEKRGDSVSPDELADTNQKISDATRRLNRLGKSPDDVIALFKRFELERFDSLPDDWSAVQFWTSLELMCLCTFRAVQAGSLPDADPVALTILALWYGDVVKYRAYRLIDHMFQDYESGKKSREGGAERLDTTPEDIAIRQDRVFSILIDLVRSKPLLRSLSKINRNERLAKEYEKRHGDKISYKTVERDLKAFRFRK